ncbi:MAG: LuxR C-terminal-related transcriptional regulator, partial [Paracoccaceae bacterium]|nr:LuxR C-terminal-related transcriptional regulator [Paracoccaceae bacterium]
LVTGASNKQIARTLAKSEYTVRNQLNTLFRKINVVNRTQAVHRYHAALYVTDSAEIGTSDPLSGSTVLGRIDSPHESRG